MKVVNLTHRSLKLNGKPLPKINNAIFYTRIVRRDDMVKDLPVVVEHVGFPAFTEKLLHLLETTDDLFVVPKKVLWALNLYKDATQYLDRFVVAETDKKGNVKRFKKLYR